MADITTGLTLDASQADANLNKLATDAGNAGRAVDAVSAAVAKFGTGVNQSVPYVRGLSQASTDAGRSMGLLELQAYKTDAALQAEAQASIYGTRQMGLMEIEAYRLAAAQEAAGVGAGLHGLQLGRLRMELGTMVGRLTETSTVMDRMGGAVGSMAFGNLTTIGVLAGIAALAEGYKLLTDKGKEAEEQATKTATEFEKIARLGFAAQAQSIATLYSGTGVPSKDDPLSEVGIQGALRLAAQDRARIAAGRETKTRINSTDLTEYTVLSEDAQKAAKDLELVNKWLEKNQAIYTSTYGVNGKGGSLQRSAAGLIASDQPGFETDRLSQMEKDAAAANKATEALNKANEALAKYFRERTLAVSGEMGQLEKDRDAAVALVEAEKKGTEATREQQIANEVNAKLEASHITMLDDQYESAKKLIEQTVEAKFTAKDLADARKKFHAEQVKADEEDAKAMERLSVNAQKYQQDIKHVSDTISQDLLRGVEQFATRGLDSFKNFFDGVDRMAVQMVGQTRKQLETLEKDFEQALESGDIESAKNISHVMDNLESLKRVAGGVATALSAALSGYSIGSSSGNSDIGALGGAASGAAAGASFGPMGIAAGALIGAAGGLFGAGQKQEEAAAALHAAAMAAYQNYVTDKGAYLAGPQGSVAQSVADENAKYADLTKRGMASGEYYEGHGPDDLIAAHQRNLDKITEDFFGGIAEQFNAVNGPAGAYENQIRAINKQYEENTAAAKALGLGEGALSEIEDIRAKSIAQLADAQYKQQRSLIEDAQFRYMTATGDGSVDALKRKVDERNEIENAIAQGADAATIAMIKQAQAAEDLKSATDAAVAAAQKELDAKRQLQDLNVRDLTALGESQAAKDLRFQLDQQRELEDAISGGKSADYISLLKKTLQDEADSYHAQQLIASTTGPSSAYGGGTGSAYATNAVTGSVTERSALELLDLTRSEVSYLASIDNTLKQGGAGGGTVVNVSLNVRIAGDLTYSERVELAESLVNEVASQLGTMTLTDTLHSGTVSR